MVLSFCLLAGGCTSRSSPAPVINLQRPLAVSDQYQVVEGDTLYSIAWRYQMDYRRLAKLNDINAPYDIFPGQTIHLKASRRYTKPLKSSQPKRRIVKTLNAPKPAQKVEKSKKITKAAPAPSPKIKPQKQQKQRQLSDPKSWVWPTQGDIKNHFSIRNSHKGIDIVGEMGQSVRSVANGKVVYSGNGLVGLTNLIIIKHSDDYLSAYAHNSERLVKEGDWVTQGQTVAHMGKDQAGKPSLYFEIRFRGKPVNPLKYLGKTSS